MKILILGNNVDGIYLFRRELILHWIKKGNNVVTVLPKEGDISKIRDLGCKVIEISMERRGMNPIKDSRLLLSYFAILKKEKPDVVLTYTIKPNLYGGIAARVLKIPYFINVTGLGTAIKNGGILSQVLLKMYHFSTKKAKCVFFQNQENMDFMLQHSIGNKHHRLLPGSGVNMEEHPLVEYPSEEKELRFLAIFRIMKDKGIEEYLSLIEKMMEKNKSKTLKFALIGSYEEETKDYYQPKINRLIHKGWLTYYGYSDRVSEIMAEYHVIIHPSYHEGMSNVLLEAASCGRPILATKIAGCKETFIEGKSGIGFLPADTKDLIRAVEELLKKTEEEKRNMGLAGRQHIEKNFDRKIIIQAYEEEIEKGI